MARGYEGAFGRKLNSPWVWIPLCVLFLAPFLDPRRPFRMLHLDLLVLLGFGVSHVFFNRGEIGLSVPLVYPVLRYLLARLLWPGCARGATGGALVPLFPVTWLAVGLVLLVGFRVGLNVIDSNVIDVGYAGVIGADRIADGDALYGPASATTWSAATPTGRSNYLLYVPFEQAMPWSGAWDDLPAAHGAALGVRPAHPGRARAAGPAAATRRGGPRAGRGAGMGVGGLPVRAVRAGDELQRLAGGAGDRARDARRSRSTRPRGLSAAARGAGGRPGRGGQVRPAGPGAAVRPPATRGRRCATARRVRAVLCGRARCRVAPFVPDGGVREMYDRTVGYQAARPRPSASGASWTRSAGCRPRSRRGPWPGAGGGLRARAAGTRSRWPRLARRC